MTQPWYRSLKVLLFTSLLMPPVGLILQWLLPGTRMGRRILNSIYITLLAFAYLYLFFGLRLEFDGTGVYPIVSFYKPESHYAALEQQRSKQHDSFVSETVAPAISDERLGPSKKASHNPAEILPKSSAADLSRPEPSVDWTDFRGPRRDGHYDELPIMTNWPAPGPPLLWRQPVGGGYASFVIAKGRAFTIEQRRQQEVVAAYDLETGRELWTHAWDAEFRESMGGDGPRATPTWDDGRLYALGATGKFCALDAQNGRLIWSCNILKENQANNLTWGMAASPLVVDDKVITLPGGPSGKSVVAYNKLTGRTIWKVLDDQQAYTSPMLVTLAGQRQILVVSARRAMGLAVEDGRLLWDYPWVTDHGINSAQPLMLGLNRFFLSAGYGHGCAVVEVIPSDRGFAARTVWQNARMKNKFTSSVLDGGYIYGLDEAILTCLDADSGELKWKGGRYGYGQVLLASGHLIVLTESGDLVLVKATPERHRELARFSAIDGKTWNHPAIAQGRLLVRNANQMACFNVRGLHRNQ